MESSEGHGKMGVRGESSYVQVWRKNDVHKIHNCSKKFKQSYVRPSRSLFTYLKFKFEDAEESCIRFKKDFVGEVESPGMMYTIQNIFNIEGYFAVKTTSLGANLYLLEEMEEGELKAFVENGKERLN